ncbi:uncharacterized protein N7479_010048 [Penicillium vulpinum]|uniref:uncharacterized protein n=1 Tax=Penicillium vulpinum TaxID=29845 RepID=UPI002547C1D0|nr:uncharacterized protein N7479_010048 [Penicillium vulpinum]KAJ5951635.1 hypothetical protein N7479_010048 [Penicillium vulpinum]
MNAYEIRIIKLANPSKLTAQCIPNISEVASGNNVQDTLIVQLTAVNALAVCGSLNHRDKYEKESNARWDTGEHEHDPVDN